MSALETKIAVLESDVSRMMTLFEKMDFAIEKMGDVSNNIGRMLAVHEQRLVAQDITDKELHILIEKRRQELEIDIKELHSRITTVSRELSGDISETEQRLMVAMSAGMSDIKKCFTGTHNDSSTRAEDLEKRVSDLERWKWLVMGGSVAMGAFANEIISSLIK